MTDVEQTGSRARWSSRRGNATTTGATPTDTPRGRWFGSRNADAEPTSDARHDKATHSASHDATHDDSDATTQVVHDPDATTRRRTVDHAQMRDRFGGRKVGAAFFGWLVAVGMTVMLSTIAAAVGLIVGDSMDLDPAGADAAPIGLTGAVVALVVLGVSYFAGGYVAGRLARFDGVRNGILAWVIGLLVTVVAVVTGMVAGTARSDLFGNLRLPVLTGDAATLTIAGMIALAAVLLVTAVAAALGGRMGEGFHRRVDRAVEKL